MVNGYIVDSDYIELNNSTFVRLFGRLDNGKSFCVLNSFEPYFFIKTEDVKKIDSLLKEFVVNSTKLKTFNFENVSKISTKSYSELKKLVSVLKLEKIDCFESDLAPNVKYLIDKDIKGTFEISGDCESVDRIDCFFKEAKISPSFFKPKLKVLSLDIETSKDGKLFCIGVFGENLKKNFLISDKKLKDTINCLNELDCLNKFKQEVIEYDPDIITGWNFIDFDLVFLQNLFRQNNLLFDLGRTNETLKLRIEKNFFKSSTVKITGRQALDGLNFIKDPFIQEAPSIKGKDFESYTLENVSQNILGEGKLIKEKTRHDKIEMLYYSKDSKKLQELVDYNILDCKLVYDILEKTKIVDLAVERSQLTGMMLNRITASIASFDSLYIREARKVGLVSPDSSFAKKDSKIKGGYVYSSKPGVYNNVLVLDFKSLYPSIIRTFNIDPSSFLIKKEKNCIISPNGAIFRNSDGILPKILDKLHSSRELAKKEKKELSSYAIKIIMNSFFGVLASPNSRYFNFDMANSITNFGQMIIKLTSQEIEKLGYKVLYSDTDSVFVETGKDEKKSQIIGKEIENFINNFYSIFINKEYKRKSFLELQFQKQYISLLIPSIRTRDDEQLKAAKKRYAGFLYDPIISKRKIEVVGLEAIRGDWTNAAKEFQMSLLEKVFKKESVEEFIKNFVSNLTKGNLDDKLVYRKSIRKGLTEYTKTTPPHVKAARQLDSLDSNVIEYYITTEGPEPLQKLKHKLDYDHYIDKQIKPIANQVLNLIGKNFDELISKSKQKTLF